MVTFNDTTGSSYNGALNQALTPPTSFTPWTSNYEPNQNVPPNAAQSGLVPPAVPSTTGHFWTHRAFQPTTPREPAHPSHQTLTAIPPWAFRPTTQREPATSSYQTLTATPPSSFILSGTEHPPTPADLLGPGPKISVTRPYTEDRASVSFRSDEIDVKEWNMGYSFVEAIPSISAKDRRLLEPDYLIFATTVSHLVQRYRHFTAADLRTLSTLHWVTYQGLSKDQLEAHLLVHQCSNRCDRLYYVFKELRRQRKARPWADRVIKKNWSNFIPGGHDRRSSSAPRPLDTSQNLIPGTSIDTTSPRGEVRPPNQLDTSHLEPPTRSTITKIIRDWQSAMSLEKFLRRPCAVCSGLTFLDDLTTIHASKINLTVLRNDRLPESVTPRSYNYHAYDRAILEPKGLDNLERKGDMALCKICRKDTLRGVMPRLALANWLYYGRDCLPPDVRRSFEELSVFEKAMICRVRTNSLLCRFTGIDEDQEDGSFSNGRRHIRGNIISTPLDVARLNSVLPPSPETVRDTMCAIFVSSIPPTQKTIDNLRPILVRKSRIKTLIEFLVRHNPHYKSSEGFRGYSREYLDSLFDGSKDSGVPKAVEIAHITTSDAIESTTSSYTDPYDGCEGLFMENVAYTLGDHSTTSYREMTLQAMQRCKDGKPFISYRAGSNPVPDINNPNWLSWAHPNADPYGIGGFNDPRRTRPIGVEMQLRHLLNVQDPYFESDPELAFDVYNIVRKSMVNTSLRFSVPYTAYARIVRELTHIDKRSLGDLRYQFQRNPNYTPQTDAEADVMRLVTSISPVARKIPGSVAQKIKMRNEIRAIINLRGSPTLFVTLNPADWYNPIVPVLGTRCSDAAEIERLSGLSPAERREMTLAHPVACATFFDAMIKSFLKVILRYDRKGSKKGIFGKTTAYYGTVETQGRGSLHCHLLIWLEGHLPPENLASALQTSLQYRDRLRTWLDTVLESGFVGSRAHLNRPQVANLHAIEQDTTGRHPGTILGPLLSAFETQTFQAEMREDVDGLLTKFNWHDHTATCWKYLQPNEPKTDENCRFGMDGQTIPETVIDPESGAITLRRRHPKMTHYNPILTFLLRCNTDIKFIGSGDDAKAFMYYVTDYITKAPLSMHAGLTALTYAIVQGESRGLLGRDDLDEIETRRAMTIAVNSMLGHQEISHPQVMSYIMGGGECYTNETFQAFNWAEVLRYVHRETEARNESGNDADDTQPSSRGLADLSVSVGREGGVLDVSNQLLDYIYRPEVDPFNSMGLYRFVACTTKSTYTDRRQRFSKNTAAGFSSSIHPQFDTHGVKLRTRNAVPVLLGPRVSRKRGSDQEKEDWARDMCILFKSWRHPSDLRNPAEDWYTTASELSDELDEEDRIAMENMSLLAEAKQARDERPRKRSQRNRDPLLHHIDTGQLVDASEAAAEGNVFSKVGLRPGSLTDSEYRVMDLETVTGPEIARVFASIHPRITSATDPIDGARPSEEDDPNGVIAEQQAYMIDNRPRKPPRIESNMNERRPTGEATHSSQDHPPRAVVSALRNTLPSNGTVGDQQCDPWAIVQDVLNERGLQTNAEQLRAYLIFADHIVQGGPQMLAYVGGRGGTGKTHLIKTIQVLFERLNRSNELRLGAPTGIAASLIGGSTLHALLAMGPTTRSKVNAKLISEWKGVKYFIVDEVSMLGAQFMAVISSRLRMARGDELVDDTSPFGGIYMIFMGDFHQLAPPKQPSLYSHRIVRHASFSQARNNQGINSMAGVYLWRQVNVVVILQQNKRQEDDITFATLLDSIRNNTCIGFDGLPTSMYGHTALELLQRRDMRHIAHHHSEELANFIDAPVVVGSKTLRDALNVDLLQSHAQRLNQQTKLYYSVDTVRRKAAQDPLRSHLWNLPSRKTDESLGQLPLFVGMRVMITENLSVPFKIVNGSEGTVTSVRYHTDEEGRRFADVVYVKVDDCHMSAPGLEEGEVPIFPSFTSITHTMRIEGNLAKSFRRRQIPVTPAYSYTDYKSQGRTLKHAIVDIASARGQGVYVMLSRVRSLSSLMVLRWFPASKIHQRMSGELREELQRLEALDMYTLQLFNEGTIAAKAKADFNTRGTLHMVINQE